MPVSQFPTGDGWCWSTIATLLIVLIVNSVSSMPMSELISQSSSSVDDMALHIRVKRDADPEPASSCRYSNGHYTCSSGIKWIDPEPSDPSSTEKKRTTMRTLVRVRRSPQRGHYYPTDYELWRSKHCFGPICWRKFQTW